MASTKATARTAGAVYFLFMLVAIFGEFLFPRFMVPGDAAATAGNITSAELTYRVGILLSFVTHLVFIVLVVILYKLFKEVDSSLALLMVLLVSVGVAVALANMLNRFAPLVLLGSDESMVALTKPQLDALALGALRLHGRGAAVPMVFWGLWLFPFGSLVIKSRFLPRLLGYLLIVAGIAYLAAGVIAIVLPDRSAAAARLLMPLYFGEVPIIFWMLLKGARELPQQGAAAA